MIQIEGVTKEYDLPPGQSGKLVAADQLSLTIARGEVFGLVGPNGAGKTTTLKIVCGLLAPTSGKVSVNQVDVLQEPDRAQEYIGYLSDFFLSMTTSRCGSTWIISLVPTSWSRNKFQAACGKLFSSSAWKRNTTPSLEDSRAE